MVFSGTEEHAASKVRRTYLFVIGVLLFAVAIQLSSSFLFHIPRTGAYRIAEDLWEIILLGLPILLFFLITKEKPREVFQFHKVSFKNIAYVVLLAILFIPISGAIGTVSQLVFPNPVLENAMRVTTSQYSLWFALVVATLQPALFEELFFRGIVRDGFDSYPLKRQALLVGICFGLFHLNFSQMFYAAVLGVLMVYIFYYTRSIIATMVFHFATNGIDVTLSHLLASRASAMTAATVHVLAATPYSMTSLIVVDVGILLAIFIPLARAVYRSFVKYNKRRLGMIDPAVPLPVTAAGSDQSSGVPVVTQGSVPVHAQYDPADVQASIHVAVPATQAAPVVAPSSAQPAISEQHDATATATTAVTSPENPEPLSPSAAPPVKRQRLFSPLLIVVFVIAIGYATFVQVYDTLIIR